MPRKHKRITPGMRRARQKAAKERERALGETPHEDNHLRFIMDPMEFTCLVTAEGGLRIVGNGAIVRAFDAECRDVRSLFGYRFKGQPVAPDFLPIGRDKAAKLMARANDAAQIRQIREDLREQRKQKQVKAIREAENRHATLWLRQDVPDQRLRSILTGSNNGKDPTLGSDGLHVCYRGDDGRYYIVSEYWPGDWSEPDEDGYRFRERVKEEPLTRVVEQPDGSEKEYIQSFHDEDEALAAYAHIMRSGMAGSLDGNKSSTDAEYMRRQAKRLKKWQRGERDMKAKYQPKKKAGKPKQKPDHHDGFMADVRADSQAPKKPVVPTGKKKHRRISPAQLEKLLG